MKNINRFSSFFAIVALLLMTSCEEDVVRDPSPQTNPNSSNIFFSKDNISNQVLSISTDSFDVTLQREKYDSQQTVNLSVENVYGEAFEIPNEVTFAAGDSLASITIKVKDLILMKKYHVAISIDQDQTNPYVAQDVFPKIELTVLKEDFAPFAEGTYSSEFFEDSWSATLEYSPSTTLYRFKNCWAPGYNVTFKWDGAKVNIQGTTTLAGDQVYLQTGYVSSKYGMVSAYYYTDDLNYYDEETQTFTFPIEWRVSVGSYGDYYDSYVITSKY